MTTRLWRALGAAGPLFVVEDGTSAAALDDRRIISISIEAGTTMAGLSTSGATVEVSGYHAYLPPSDNAQMTIRLTNHGMALLSSLTGKPASLLQNRFVGRLTAHDVTDTGDGDRATKLRTTLTAQDWASFVSQLDKGALVTKADPNLWSLYQAMFSRAAIPRRSTLTPWGSIWHWVRFTPEEDGIDRKEISTGDILSRYTRDVGNFIRQDRDGAFAGWSHDHIRGLAEDWSDYHPDPLQRSQVLSPVTWRRAATIPKSIHWQQTTAIGDPGPGVGYSFQPDGDLITRAATLDMMHLWDVDWHTQSEGGSGYAESMRAIFYRERGTDLTLDAVTIDVLKLAQGTPADRAQLGQLLTLSHGDPLAIGHDWPPEVRGVHFVQTISHKITRDQWTITLDLIPAAHVTGTAAGMDLAGRSWDTAYPQTTTWASPTTTWEDSP